MDNRRGLYFLGDDGAYNQVLPLLESIRQAAPDVRVCCIAFTDRLERISQLESRYNFSIINDPTLAELDEIGMRLFDKMTGPVNRKLVGTFRKLYFFWGPLERFFYTDADVLMFDGFAEFFKRVTADDAPTLGYAHDDVGQVYLPGTLREQMVNEYNTRAINTGLFASKAELFTLAQIRELAIKAEPIAHKFYHTLEQPFINWMLDINRVEMKRFDTPGLECAWSGDPRPMKASVVAGGGMRLQWPDGSRVPAIHFAGYGVRPRMPHYDVYRHFAIAALPYRERMRMYGREFVHTPGILHAGRFGRRLVRRILGR